MLNWKKLGLVYDASKHIQDWAKNSALTPTPYIRLNGDIRVFCGFRDELGVSRIGYVDLDSDDPTNILSISSKPVLDIGRDGCFDDNGIILGDVIRVENKIYLFYIGFQLVSKVKFLAFTGLAISSDDGDTFNRLSDSPILDRHPGENYFAAVHSVFYSNGLWRLWYGAGDNWKFIGGKPYPIYGVHYVEGADLTKLPYERKVCLLPLGDEYRIGRPRVYFSKDNYEMHYTVGKINGEYQPGIAYSSDGISWIREKKSYPINLGNFGWDSRHLSYPVKLCVKGREFIFYNGNDMGKDGFGVAELT